MSRATRGYLLVAGSFLIMGLIGALVEWATAPESALLVLRFATAGIVLGIIFARRRPLAGAAARSVWPRLLLMAVIDAFTLLLFFVAIRGTSVAIGMFLQFLAPVWVAIIAPRVFRARTEGIVYPALAIALAGLAVILGPSLLGEGIKLSPWGVTAGLLAGVGYAVFQLVVKDLTKRISAVTIVFTEAWLDALILLPLALWQTVGAGYRLTTHDLVAGLILGVVCTALAYLMWTHGMGMIKVQQSAILGYLEPVSAPVYALLLLGQAISLWTSSAARSSWSPACSWCCSVNTRRRAPSPWSRRHEGAAPTRAAGHPGGHRTRRSPSRARAWDAKAWRIRYARRTGRRRSPPPAAVSGGSLRVTILLIYSRLWPDPG
jgi:DME family drug/metabolite transporter